MTKNDYSPEAVEQYFANQNRIATWIKSQPPPPAQADPFSPAHHLHESNFYDAPDSPHSSYLSTSEEELPHHHPHYPATHRRPPYHGRVTSGMSRGFPP